MQLTIGACLGIVTVRPELEYLDASNAAAFRAAFEQAVPPEARAALDLATLAFIDSSGCGTMLALLRRAAAAGGDLKLCGLRPPVRTILQMVRMHRVFDLCHDPAEAVAAFVAPAVQ